MTEQQMGEQDRTCVCGCRYSEHTVQRGMCSRHGCDAPRPSGEQDVLVEALARALTDADPTCVPSVTWKVVREEHREYRRQHARALMALGLRLPTCDLCGDVLIWHEGNGGQWIGAVPPRDWMTCHGSVDGPRHKVSTPPATTCPTCGPTTTEPHPRQPGVTRCANCKEWLNPPGASGGDR